MQLPRAVFDQAVSWALNTGKSNFWKGAQEQRTFTYGSGTDYFPNLPTYDIQISAFGQTQLNEE